MAIKIWVNEELLDVPEDTQLTLKNSSPIFETEVERGEYSYPFKLPLTQRNSKILGFPEQLTVTEEIFTFNAELERLGSISSGILFVDSVGFDHNLQQGYAECTFAGTDGKLFNKIDGKKLWELTYGGSFAVPVYSPINAYWNYHSNVGLWATDITNGTITDKPFVFPMIKWDNFGTDTGDVDILEYYVNLWQKTPQFANDIGPRFADIGISGNKQRLIPMFKTKWIVQQIFAEYGFTVGGSFFDTPTFEADIIINSYSVNKWQMSGTGSAPQNTDLCTEINPANHLPDMYVVDFLNIICKRFCGQFMPNGPKSYEFVLKKDVINTTAVTAIENKYLSPFISKKLNETKDAQKKINLEYTDTDTFFENNVIVDTDVAAIKGSVNTVADLAGVASPADGDIYLVKNLNQLWKYFTEGAAWFFHCYNFINYKPYKNGNDLTLEAAPLINVNADFSLVDYGVGGITYNLNTPEIDVEANIIGDEWVNGATPGSTFYILSSKRTYLPLRFMLWYGLTENYAANYAIPYCSGYNYDQTSSYNKVYDYNLGLYGPDGLYNQFYRLWNLVMGQTTKYELQTYLPEHDVNALSFKEMMFALDQKFLLYSRAFTEPYRGVASLEVYKIPYYVS